jgi:hypothetical protein
MNSELQHPSSFFTEIRAILQNARQRAYRSVGFVMVEAYWQIGKRIVEEEQHGAERAEYGKRLLRELAQQLTAEFGNGFSTRNLESMRKFFLTYRDRRLLISQTLSAKSNSSTPTRPEDTGDSLPSAEAQTGATHRHIYSH